MKTETPGQKWDRLQSEIQQGILNAYPNRERKGCVDENTILELVKRAAEFDDGIEDDPRWQHVTHCAPCYRQYLQQFEKGRSPKPRSQTE